MGPDRYEYFSFKVTDADADLTVAVTPFTGGERTIVCGMVMVCSWVDRNWELVNVHRTLTCMKTDPDVYVSPAPHRPNTTHHEWSATGFGRGASANTSGRCTDACACG